MFKIHLASTGAKPVHMVDSPCPRCVFHATVDNDYSVRDFWFCWSSGELVLNLVNEEGISSRLFSVALRESRYVRRAIGFMNEAELTSMERRIVI